MTRRLKAATLTSDAPVRPNRLWLGMPETRHRIINIIAPIFVRLAKINIGLAFFHRPDSLLSFSF